MKELRDQFSGGSDILSLTERELDSALLKIVIARADGDGLMVPKFLSLGELENVYGASLSLPADRVKEINERLAAAYQRLLSASRTMPAPGQPIGVVTVSPSGRLGLAPAEKSLLEWAGGSRVTFGIVFTDIVGSTALNVELGDAAMSEVRVRHFAQSTALLAKYAGYEVKTIGDSVMAVFRSVEAALGYARELQAEPGSSELQVRAGIHIGPVEVTVNDIFGAEVAFASRVVAAIAGAEIWLSSRAKEDVDRAGIHREEQWKPHDVSLKGIGLTQLWSLVLEPTGEGQSLATMPTPSAEEQRAEAARRFFAPELARIMRRQIYILGRAVSNFTTTSVGKPSAGDSWTSLKPAQPTLYPTTPEFSKLSAEDAILLNEYYNLVQEITDTINSWINNEPPPPEVNAWNVLMQKVRHSLEAGKIAVERFCPDRQFDATLPAAGTLIDQIEVAISPVKRVLDAHLARHAAADSAPKTYQARRAFSPTTKRPLPPRGPHSWMAK